MKALFIQLAQANDSLRKPVIGNQIGLIQDIASDSLHFCQGDAKVLLENSGITQEYHAWLPDGSTLRNFRIPAINSPEIQELCDELIIYPNPSNGNMIVKYDLGDVEGIPEIRLTATDGKIINTFLLPDLKGEIRINCNTCITGNYMLTLLVDGYIYCTKELNIKK